MLLHGLKKHLCVKMGTKEILAGFYVTDLLVFEGDCYFMSRIRHGYGLWRSAFRQLLQS